MLGPGGRLVRRHPDRRGAGPVQPGLVAARARPGGDHAPHHRRARAGQRRSARGRNGAARQIEPARNLGQPVAALRRLRRQGGRHSRDAALRRFVPCRSTISPAWPSSARRCPAGRGCQTIRRRGSSRPTDFMRQPCGAARAGPFSRVWVAGEAAPRTWRREEARQDADARRGRSHCRGIVAGSRARRGDRDRGRDLGLGAKAGRLASGHRRGGKFSRLGVRRLRRRRGRGGGGGGDRQRRAADAGVRRRRRDGLAGRALLRRPHQSLCREARADAARRPQGA